MSCPCAQCYSLGCRVEDNESNTTRSREVIERHQEIYRRQILLIESLGNLENAQPMKNDAVMDQSIAVKEDEKMGDLAGDNQAMVDNGSSTNGRQEMDQDSRASASNSMVKSSSSRKSLTPSRRTNSELPEDKSEHPKADHQETENPESDSISAHCRSVLPKRRLGTSAFARCNLCTVDKVVYTSSGVANHPIVLQHVLIHFEHKVYSCHHCDYKSNRTDRIKCHFKTAHRNSSTKLGSHFEDNINQYVEEIKELITKCFGNPGDSKATTGSASKMLRRPEATKLISRRATIISQAAKHETSTIGSHRSSFRLKGRKMVNWKSRLSSGIRIYRHGIKIHCPARTDTLAKIRQDLCWRLIRNAGHPDRIRCQQCGDGVSTRRDYHDGPISLRRHIQMVKHFPTPTYGCRLCHSDWNSYTSLCQHFQKKHRGVSVTNNYDNRENEYHDDIIRGLLACFGDKDSAKDVSTTGGSSNKSMVKPTAPRKSRTPNRRISVDVPKIKNEHPNGSLQELDNVKSHQKEIVARMDVNRTPRIELRKIPIANKHNYMQPIIQLVPIVQSSPSNSVDQRIQMCNDLIKKYSKDETIDCRVCKTTLRIDREIDPILAHVETVHLQGSSSPYRCRQCDYRCITELSMRAHLHGFHKLKCVDGQYEAVDLDGEFVELLRQCFDRDSSD